MSGSPARRRILIHAVLYSLAAAVCFTSAVVLWNPPPKIWLVGPCLSSSPHILVVHGSKPRLVPLVRDGLRRLSLRRLQDAYFLTDSPRRS